MCKFAPENGVSRDSPGVFHDSPGIMRNLKGEKMLRILILGIMGMAISSCGNDSPWQPLSPSIVVRPADPDPNAIHRIVNLDTEGLPRPRE